MRNGTFEKSDHIQIARAGPSADSDQTNAWRRRAQLFQRSPMLSPYRPAPSSATQRLQERKKNGPSTRQPTAVLRQLEDVTGIE